MQGAHRGSTIRAWPTMRTLRRAGPKFNLHEDEMKLIGQNLPMFAPQWEDILEKPRPIAVNAFYRLTRMQDSAMITALRAFANAYFAQFGTSGE